MAREDFSDTQPATPPDEWWRRVQDIFLEAADLSPSERALFLSSACGRDAALRLEVESLLAEDSSSESTLDAAIQAEASSMLEEPLLIGTRLGVYRVIQQAGHGGMGSVYLAERDDDQYRKRVAIKVVKRGMDTEEVLRRFRHERQILAGLEHPYIARLIDGGTTPDGRPFFVMEHVEGEPIDVYCNSRKLDVKSRLRLFQHVCEAVSHAHRALVVHRDLKPGNILVTANGVPKLLDFGVAKLLDTETDSGTNATLFTAYGIGPLTPEYASPEQVRGLPVTTAADIYALGAILFELLTGARAQKIDTQTPAEIDRIVCETQPQRPSSLAKGLDSDLDNIVLMAMRKERERRYPSVDQLAEDIQRYLDGLPVHARRDSFAYRASKFVRRNCLAVSAAALLFATLLAGVGVSLYQARKALAARSVAEIQRQTADRERARAEVEAQVAKTEQDRSARRLSQMVELADRSLYDVHSAIETLPGATEARRQIVATTLQFLESLSKDAGSDDRLVFVLSAAYMKVADVQGYPMRPNLGDTKGALDSYRKSIDLIQPLVKKEPGNTEYVLQELDSETHRAQLHARMGAIDGTIAQMRGLLPAAREVARKCPKDPRCLLAESDIYAVLADTMRLGDRDSQLRLKYSQMQTQSLERALRALPQNRAMELELATAYSQEAGAFNALGDVRQAADRFQRAISLRERLLQQDPSDVLTRRLLMISYGNMGANLGHPLVLNLGDSAGARQAYAKALAIARELAKADSSDQLAQYDLANALLYYASLDLPAEEWKNSLEMLREADGIIQKLIAADPQSLPKFRTLATIQEYEGRRLEGLGQTDEAIGEYRQSLATTEKMLARDGLAMSYLSQALADEEAIARALVHQHRAAEAVEMARKAVGRAEHIAPTPSERERATRYVSKAYGTLADVLVLVGDPTGARAAAGRAVAGWSQLKASGGRFFDPSEYERMKALANEAASDKPPVQRTSE